MSFLGSGRLAEVLHMSRPKQGEVNGQSQRLVDFVPHNSTVSLSIASPCNPWQAEE